MKSEFKLCKSGSCGITITGLERDNNSYTPEDDNMNHFQTYKWSESVTVNVIRKIRTDESIGLTNFEIKDHNVFPIDDSTFQMEEDGIYELEHMIVPTRTWFQNILDKEVDPSLTFSQYEKVVFYDADKDSFVTYENGVESDMKPTAFISNSDYSDSTIVSGLKNTFNLCHLNNCLYIVNKNILDIISTKCSNNQVKELTYNRDLIWMGINTIKYLIDLQHLFEAQGVLERLTFCHDICDPNNKYNYSDCGCD